MIWITFAFLFVRFFYSDLALFPPGFIENNWLHRGCVAWTAHRELAPVYGGLFCGSNDIDGETKNLFLRTGLYHLLVVSGAHLILLERLLDRLLRERQRLKLAVFFLFALTCQLNPPILRALFGQGFRLLSKRQSLFLNDETRLLLAGLWCLILFPQWLGSLSLLLSWAASLALNYRIAEWKKHFVIALYLLPWVHALSFAMILNNLVFGLVFETILFPLSFVCFVLPGLTVPGNLLWSAIAAGLAFLPTVTTRLTATAAESFWAYIFAIHLWHRVKR